MSTSDVMHSSGDSAPETPDTQTTAQTPSTFVPSQIMDPSDPPLVPISKYKRISHTTHSAYQNSRNISDKRSDPTSSGLSSPSDKNSTQVSGSLSYAAMAQRQTTAIIVKSDQAAKAVIVMPPKQPTGNNNLDSVKTPTPSAAIGRGRRNSANHNNTSAKNVSTKKQINQKSSPAKKPLKSQRSDSIDEDREPAAKPIAQQKILKQEKTVAQPALPSFAQLLRPVAIAPVVVKPIVVEINEQLAKPLPAVTSSKPIDKPTDAVELAQLKAAIVATATAPTWHTIKVNGKKRTVLQEEPADFWEEKEEEAPKKPIVVPADLKAKPVAIPVTVEELTVDEDVPVVTRKPKTKKSKSKKANNKSEIIQHRPIEEIPTTIGAVANVDEDQFDLEEYNFVTDPEAIFANAIAPINLYASPRSDKSLMSQSGSNSFGGMFASPNFGVKSSMNDAMLRQEEDMVMRIMRSLSSVEPKSPIEVDDAKQLNAKTLLEETNTIKTAKSDGKKDEVEDLVDELTDKNDLICEAFLNTEFDVAPVTVSKGIVEDPIQSINDINLDSIASELQETTNEESKFDVCESTDDILNETSKYTLSNGSNIKVFADLLNNAKNLKFSSENGIDISEQRNELQNETATNGEENLVNGSHEHKLQNGHAKSNGRLVFEPEDHVDQPDLLDNSDQLITGTEYNSIDGVGSEAILDGNVDNTNDILPNEIIQLTNGCEANGHGATNENGHGIGTLATDDILQLSIGKMDQNSTVSTHESCIKVDGLFKYEEPEESESSLDQNDTDGSSELSSITDTDDDDRTVVGPLDGYIEDVMINERDSQNLLTCGECYDGDDSIIDPIHDGDIDELIKQAEHIVRLSTDVGSWAKATQSTVLYKEQERNESPRSSEDSGILENHDEPITSATESESGQSDQYLKFPLTEAVARWLQEKQKEKSPEPIIRIPEHPILSGQIEKSIQRFQISEMLKSYADDEEDDADEYDGDDVSTDDSEAEVLEATNTPPKNLQSNPLPALSADRTTADNIDNRVATPNAPGSTTVTPHQTASKETRRVSAEDDPDILEYWENDPMLQAPKRKGGRSIDYAKLLAKVSTKTTIDFMLANGSSSKESADHTFSQTPKANVRKSETGCALM